MGNLNLNNIGLMIKKKKNLMCGFLELLNLQTWRTAQTNHCHRLGQGQMGLNSGKSLGNSAFPCPGVLFSRKLQRLIKTGKPRVQKYRSPGKNPI
jgi:hypothetical protein